MIPTEAVILCEGYHDRAFWAGWLLRLGCSDPGHNPEKLVRERVIDPWNELVAHGGQFGFHSTSSSFIRIVPCQGRSGILPKAKRRLVQRATKSLSHLVLNIDTDQNADTTTTPEGMKEADVREYFARNGVLATPNSDGDLVEGETTISLVRWEAPGASDGTLPNQHTLERLVCAALCAAYPSRGAVVRDWLNSRTDPPAIDPKEHSWSHMAGWYAGHGCDDFFRNLWREPAVAQELERILRDNGAWRIAEALAT